MLLDKLVCQCLKESLDDVMTDLLADKVLYAAIVEFNHLLLNLLRIEFLYLSYDLTTGKFLDEKGCTSCRIIHYQRIRTALITE